MTKIFDAKNTIGSKPCEVVLNQILAEFDEQGGKHIRSKVMRKYNHYRAGLKEIAILKNSTIKRALLKLWRSNELEKLDDAQDYVPLRDRETGKLVCIGNPLPPPAYKHLRCAMVACYRDALEQAKTDAK